MYLKEVATMLFKVLIALPVIVGEAKVGEFDVAVFVHEEVLRLHVPVNHLQDKEEPPLKNIS